MFSRSSILFALVCLLAFNGAMYAQNQVIKNVEGRGVSLGKEDISHWQVGVVVRASKGPIKHVYATVPIPMEWPEQRIKTTSEDVSRGVRVTHRELGGVRQLVVSMPGIPKGRSAKALFTFEIVRNEIIAPTDTTLLRVPKKVPRPYKKWLNSSPYIDSRDSKIRSLARAAAQQQETAWEKVETIYDLVREKIEYKEGDIKTASQALRDGVGDCEELTSVFIAMCRSIKVPARMVWVPDHCYPEFYLEDDGGVGHWIPCQAAGTRAFGSMPEMRPILQKGDNFKVKEKSKPQRYVAEYVSAKPIRGSGPPDVTFVRRYVSPEE